MSKLWGGRFGEGLETRLARFSTSLDQDRRLWQVDIRASQAHVRMLANCGVVSTAEADLLLRGLAEVEADLKKCEEGLEPWPFQADAEDIHSEIERLLREKTGSVASQMHRGRSRNDQVAVDVRLWLRSQVDALAGEVESLQHAVLRRARESTEWLMPGLTHFQPAQPVSLAHHLMAYFWMWNRDRLRLADARVRLNECPLGAGALAGVSGGIDRRQTADELGFEGVSANSMDTVASRDQMTEVVFALTQLMIHHSRICDEIILWTNPQFGFASLPDRLSTGSSMMPQKKNPDFAELIRGRSARVIGHLNHLLAIVKGLPLTYNRDLQEDKVALFDAMDTARSCTRVLTEMVEALQFFPEVMRASLGGDFSNATELADVLSGSGLAFREAHEITGQVVKWCLNQGRTLESLSASELNAIDARIPGDIDVTRITHEAAFVARDSEGGTAPSRVREQIQRAEQALAR